MKSISLFSGESVIVDDEDYEKLSRYKWHIKHGKNTSYAVTKSSRKYGDQIGVKMHQFILGHPLFGVIDHINGNGLDNRKINLRLCSVRENGCNRYTHREGKFPGIVFNKHNKKYEVRIRILGDRVNLGCFKTEQEAIEKRQNYFRTHIVGIFS